MYLNPNTKFIIPESVDSLILNRIYKPQLSDDFEKLVDFGIKFAKEKRIT